MVTRTPDFRHKGALFNDLCVDRTSRKQHDKVTHKHETFTSLDSS